jgi:hypothetical protein
MSGRYARGSAHRTGRMSPDDQTRREEASRAGHVFPSWLVMWGSYSRQFWAFPCFKAAPGTVVQAADISTLAGMMHRVQRTFRERP